MKNIIIKLIIIIYQGSWKLAALYIANLLIVYLLLLILVMSLGLVCFSNYEICWGILINHIALEKWNSLFLFFFLFQEARIK